MKYDLELYSAHMISTQGHSSCPNKLLSTRVKKTEKRACSDLM